MRTATKKSPALFVHDTRVRIARPVVSAILCVLTLSVTGAVRYGRLNSDLARFGRARGAMPFPFIACNPATAVLSWIAGSFLWLVWLAVMIGFVVDLVQGYTYDASVVTDLVSTQLLLIPLWMTTLHTAKRIRVAQHLVGLDPARHVRIYRGAMISTLIPAAGIWLLQRQANTAWRVWEEYQPKSPTGVNYSAAPHSYSAHPDYRPIPQSAIYPGAIPPIAVPLAPPTQAAPLQSWPAPTTPRQDL